MKEKGLFVILRLVRSALLFLFCLSSASLFCYAAFCALQAGDGPALNAYYGVACFFSVFLPMAILQRAFCYHDAEGRRVCRESATFEFSFRRELRRVCASWQLWCDVATFAFLLLILPVRGLGGGALGKGDSGSIGARLLTVFLILLLFLAMQIFWRLWQRVWFSRERDVAWWSGLVFPFLWGVELLLLGFVFLRSFGAMVLVFSMAAVIIFWVVLSPFLFWPFTWLWCFLRALRVRHRFLVSLRAVCREAGAVLSSSHRLFEVKLKKEKVSKPSFYLTAHGETYAVKLLAALRYENALIFSETGEGFVRYKGEYSRIYTPFSFAFEASADAKKVIVICPISREIFRGDERALQPAQKEAVYASNMLMRALRHGAGERDVPHLTPLDVGESVGGYKIFNSSSFLNGIERNCLMR